MDTSDEVIIHKIHRWVRNNFSLYIGEEFYNLWDKLGCSDYEDDDYYSSFLYGTDNN